MTDTQQAQHKYHILYIGGDVRNIKPFEESEKFSVTVKENSLKAISYLTNHEDVDVILCEVHIPGIDGIETFKLLQQKKINPEIPFILIAHEFEAKVFQEAINNKIDDLYRVPLNQERIYQRITFLKSYKKNFVNRQEEEQKSQEYRIPFFKRAFDIIFALITILILSPVLILTALAIRLESKGKVIYKAKRVGTGYNVFDFYKFRSMYTGADKMLKDLEHLNQYKTKSEEDENEQEIDAACPDCEKLGEPCSPILYIGGKEICENQYLRQKSSKTQSAFVKFKDDPRVTKVGAFIRKTSIDELPQLFNVIKGDMSIVGNRPLPLYEAELLTSDGWSERFLGPAGITGLWQVYKRGRSEMSDEERKALDNQYARNNSFWLDLKIILLTIPALFQKESV